MKFRQIIIFLLFINLLLQLYCASVIIKHPLVGITINQVSEQHWLIEKIQNGSWGATVSLEEGQEVIKINGLAIVANNKRELPILQADSVTVLENGETRTLLVSYEGLIAQLVNHFFIPITYVFVTSALCVYLVMQSLINSKSYLILHLQFTALAYISAGAAGRGDLLGNILNSLAIFLSLVSCIYFCNCFLKALSATMIRRLNQLFLLIGTMLILMNILRIWYEDLLAIQIWIELVLYLILSIFLVGMIISSFKNNSRFYAKALFSIFFLGTGPFVLFYVIPTVFLLNPILPAEIAAVFLLVVPICLAAIEFSESSVNLPYALNQLFAHLKLVIPFSLVVSAILVGFSSNQNFQQYSLYFVGMLIATVTLLTYKEWRELKNAQFMRTMSEYNFKNLYQFIRSARDYPSFDALIEYIKNELYTLLKVKTVEIVEYRNENRAYYVDQQFQEVCPGLIYKNDSHYIFVLHESVDICYLAKVDKSFERTEAEALKIVEMFLYVVQNIIEQSIKMDDLILHLSKLDQLHSPSWYRRILVSSSERERFRLSTEIHDTVLQDLIRMNRQIEEIILTSSDKEKRVALLREEMLDIIHMTRDICESLYPPFIEQVGLYQSLQELLAKYKLRVDFIIKDTIEEISYLSIQQQTAVYRIFQELLVNADKHSQARAVVFSMAVINEQITIHYEDDGVGLSGFSPIVEPRSLGLLGMQERVHYYRGTFAMYEREPNGTVIHIVMEIGEDVEINGFR